MRRRELITFLGAAAAAWPLSSRAKQSATVKRIGVLVNEPWPVLEGLHVGLDELGYHEGKDFVVEYRFAEGAAERFPKLAAELVVLRQKTRRLFLLNLLTQYGHLGSILAIATIK